MHDETIKFINRSDWMGNFSWIKNKQNTKLKTNKTWNGSCYFHNSFSDGNPRQNKLDSPDHSEFAHIHTHSIYRSHRHNYHQVLQVHHFFLRPNIPSSPQRMTFRFWCSVSSTSVAVSLSTSSFILHSFSLSVGCCFFVYLFWCFLDLVGLFLLQLILERTRGKYLFHL